MTIAHPFNVIGLRTLVKNDSSLITSIKHGSLYAGFAPSLLLYALMCYTILSEKIYPRAVLSYFKE